MTPTADIVSADEDVHQFPLIHKINLEKSRAFSYPLKVWDS